jgi:hypothetical protein
MLQRGTRLGKFAHQPGVIEAGQTRMAAGVGVEADAASLHVEDFFRIQQRVGDSIRIRCARPDILSADQAADEKHRAWPAQPFENGKGVLPHTAESVVEGQHERARGQRLAALQPCAQSVQRNRAAALPGEGQHVGFEPLGADRIPGFPGVAGRSHAVVHEDNDPTGGAHDSFRSTRPTRRR